MNINIIEKTAIWLWEFDHRYTPTYTKWEKLDDGNKMYYRNEARQLLQTMGLTDTQIKALETEDCRLAVVYKDIESVPFYLDPSIPMASKAGISIQKTIELMLAQGWVKECKGE